MFITGIEVVFDSKYVQFDEVCSIPQSIKRQYAWGWPPAFPYLLILSETHLFSYKNIVSIISIKYGVQNLRV